MAAGPSEKLEQSIDELIRLCRELQLENRELRARERDWSRERQSLMEKSELAKQRVNSMIARLKSLEQES